MDADNNGNVDVANEVISQIIESACEALKLLSKDDLVKEEDTDATNEIILDEAIEILSEVIGNALNATEATATDAVGASPTNENAFNVCDDEVSEIIEQIIELAYSAAVGLMSTDEEPNVVLQSDEKVVQKETERKSSTCDVSSDTEDSLIVECIDCIDTMVEDMTILQTTEPHEAHDSSIVVECVEVCKNDEVISSAEVNTTESSTEERVNQNSETDGICQPIDSTTSIANNLFSKPPPNTFYTDDILQSKGYFTKFAGDVKRVFNLSVPSDALTIGKVRCIGIPSNVKVNELIPMLEKGGRIYEIRFVRDANDVEVVTVTYLTKKECDSAIKILNGRHVQGKEILVEMVTERTRLIVKPIAREARKPEVFNHFNKITKFLVQVYLHYADEIHNRGYCYLSYRDEDSAIEAMKIISKLRHNGEPIHCEWATNQSSCQHVIPYIASPRVRYASVEPATLTHKLYMTNCRPGLTASDLRMFFSNYGELTEVDKSDSWASVRFRYPDDAMRAFHNVDRNKIGGKNFEISRSELREKTGSYATGGTPIKSTANANTGINSGKLYGSNQRQDAKSFITPTKGANERSDSQRRVGGNSRSSDRNVDRKNNVSVKNSSKGERGSREQSGNNSGRNTRSADQIFFLN